MIEPSKPLRIIIPGAPTISLKNERSIVQFTKNGKKSFSLVPKARVKKFIAATQAAIKRHLPDDWVVLERGIAVVLDMHLYYHSAFPRNDIDNFYTTVQECLQDTIIENDKQIEYMLALRTRTQSKLGQHSILYVWETTGFKEQELITFLQFKEKENNGNKLGLTTAGTGLDRRTDRNPDNAEILNPF